MKKNIAIFASGSGTNAENIIRFFQESESVSVALVVSNRSDAKVLERAARAGVEHRFVPRPLWTEGEAVAQLMEQFAIDFIVLAGFLARVPDCLLHRYPQRIINIHPALLPKFGGKGMYGDHVHRAVVEAGERETGITIHYINEHYDEGAIICQFRCPVEADDTPGQVAARVHGLEYAHYPEVIRRLVEAL